MRFFKTYSEKEVKRVMPLVNKINELEAEIEKLTDKELQAKTLEFKENIELIIVDNDSIGIGHVYTTLDDSGS